MFYHHCNNKQSCRQHKKVVYLSALELLPIFVKCANVLHLLIVARGGSKKMVQYQPMEAVLWREKKPNKAMEARCNWGKKKARPRRSYWWMCWNKWKFYVSHVLMMLLRDDLSCCLQLCFCSLWWQLCLELCSCVFCLVMLETYSDCLFKWMAYLFILFLNSDCKLKLLA